MYLAIDYGKKRIGLAIGMMIPSGLGIIENKNQDLAIEKIKEISDQEMIKGIVVGIPIQADCNEGKLAPEIRDFAKKLAKKTDCPVFFENEMLTSATATDFLKSRKAKHSRKSGEVDELAAIYILEQFLAHEEEIGQKNLKPDILPNEKT